MYDRINLRAMLLAVGYGETHQMTYDTSLIPDWSDYGLDLDATGEQYRPARCT
jgi:hypothetical protein